MPAPALSSLEHPWVYTHTWLCWCVVQYSSEGFLLLSILGDLPYHVSVLTFAPRFNCLGTF